MYNVNTYNQDIRFKEDAGGNLTGSMTPGFYVAGEMSALIKTTLETAGAGTYTVTLDSNTNKFTIAVSGAITNFQLTWASLSNSSNKLLGFDASDTSNTTTLTSDNAIMLSPNDIFYLSITSSSTDYRASDDSTYNIAITGSNDIGFGDILRSDINAILTYSSITALTYSLRDIDGNVLENANGNWHLEMWSL
jgi:hypothetical protein